ncbi:MAG TPA: ABC transporter permease [Chthonomonadaceae bacterium]|nr:ABC transporter permease [Chthonomonadaceae bacterium]
MTAGARASEPQRWRMPVETGVAIVLAAVMVYFSVKLPDFRSEPNVRLIVKQVAELAVISAGMTLVIATGGIDISVGSVMALCAMVLGWLCVNAHAPIGLACLGAVAVGALCGTVNGVLIARVRLPSIIVTLAMFAAASAAATMFNGGNSISGLPESFTDLLDRRDILHLPVLLWLGLASLVAGAVALKFTTFGRELLALGGNRTATFLSGRPTVRTEALVYVLSGAAAGLAAVINVAKQATAAQGTGQFMELTAITAVVLGGTIITGGRATLLGTALGVLTIGALQSGVRLLGQEDQLAWFLIGAALLLAVEAQKWRGRTGA